MTSKAKILEAIFPNFFEEQFKLLIAGAEKHGLSFPAKDNTSTLVGKNCDSMFHHLCDYRAGVEMDEAGVPPEINLGTRAMMAHEKRAYEEKLDTYHYRDIQNRLRYVFIHELLTSEETEFVLDTIARCQIEIQKREEE